MSTAAIISQLRAAFQGTPYPGDRFLQGSFDGSEPYEEVEPFQGRTDWTTLDAAFLDGHASALSFFSEGAFRFFIPAYIVADLADALQTADPVFHLTHGFFTSTTEHVLGDRTFVRRHGPSVLLSPRRYGAMTWSEHARRKLSVFAREEVAALIAYLEHRRATTDLELTRRQIDEALDVYWRERVVSAPTQSDLARHLADEAAYGDALMARYRA